MSLPTELVMMIIGWLHKSDKKNVRLVCQDWCVLATPSLFDRIYFSPFPKDFEVFREWTATPRCATAVRQLVYDASIIDSTVDVPAYAQGLWEYLQDEDLFEATEQSRFLALGVEDEEFFKLVDSSSEEPIRHPQSMQRLCKKQIVKEGFHACVGQAQQHMELRLSGELIYHLTHGLELLTNLESVCLEDDDDMQGRELRRQFRYRHWRGGADDTDFQPKSPGPMRQSGSPFARSWHPLYLHPSPCSSVVGAEYYVHESQHPFRLLVASLSLGHRSITSLRACLNSDHRVPISMFNVKGNPATPLMAQHLFNVFPTLKSLRLDIGSISWNDGVEERLKGLQDCLITIPHLQDLHICLKDLSPAASSFRNIFGAPRCIWPLLAEFAAEGMYASQQDLVGFLTEQPIRRLDLCRIRITEGSWVPVVDTLRKVIPRIERVGLSDPTGLPFEDRNQFTRTSPLMQAVARYITSGGSNPLREQELA